MNDTVAIKVRRCCAFINTFLFLLDLDEFRAPTGLGDPGMELDQNYWVVRVSYSVPSRSEGHSLWRPEVIYDPEWTNEQAVDQLLTWSPKAKNRIITKLKRAGLWRVE